MAQVKKKTASKSPQKKEAAAPPATDRSLQLKAQAESIIRSAQDLGVVAKFMFESKLFPELDSLAKAAVVIEAGRALGAHAVVAGQLIHPIRTKGGVDIVIEAKLLAAIALDNGIRWRIHQKDAKGCKVEFYNLAGDIEPHTAEFGEEDARRAGLLSKDNYRMYPEDMYYSRAFMRGIRVFDPRVGLGFYTKEEAVDFVQFSHDGDVQEAEVVEEQPQRQREPGDDDDVGEDPYAEDEEIDLGEDEEEGEYEVEEEEEVGPKPRLVDKISESEQAPFGKTGYEMEQEEKPPLPGPELDPGEPRSQGPASEERSAAVAKRLEKDIDTINTFIQVVGKGKTEKDTFTVQDFKEFLSEFQETRDPKRIIVGKNQYGKWSFHCGKAEDVHVAAENLNWIIEKFCQYRFAKGLGAGFFSLPEKKKEGE